MAKSVNIPDVGTVNFPDGMDDDAITHAIESEIIPQARSRIAARDAAEPNKLVQTATGVANTLGRSLGQVVSGVGQIMQAPGPTGAAVVGAMGAAGQSDKNTSYDQPEYDAMGSQTGSYVPQEASAEDLATKKASLAYSRAMADRAQVAREKAKADPWDSFGMLGGNLESIGDADQAYYNKNISTDAPMIGRQQKAISDADGFVGTTKAIFSNPAGAAVSLADSVVPMAAGMGLGSLAAKGVGMAVRGAAMEAGETAWQQAMLKAAANPATFADANALAQSARQAAIQDVMSANRAAAAGGVANATEGLTTGIQNSEQIKTLLNQRNEDGSYAFSDADLSKNSPRFAELIANGNTTERARTLLGAEQGTQASLGGLWTMAAGKISGAPAAMGQLITRTGRPTIGMTLRNVGKEGLEETMQGPGEDLATYQAQKEFDPNAKYDLGGSIAQNLWAGLAMGGGMHGGGHAMSGMQAPEPEVKLAGRPVAGYTDEQLQGYAKSGVLTPDVQAKVDGEIKRRTAEAMPAEATPAEVAPGAAPTSAPDSLDAAMQQFANQAGIGSETPAAPTEAQAGEPGQSAAKGDIIPNPVSTQGNLDELQRQATGTLAPAADPSGQEQTSQNSPVGPGTVDGGGQPRARIVIADHGDSATSGMSDLESARTRNDAALVAGSAALERSQAAARARGLTPSSAPNLAPIQDGALYRRANAVAEAIQSITGTKPVLFHDPSSIAPDGFELNGTSYLNAGNLERSLQFTAFHETFHVAETRARQGDVSAQQFVKTAESIFDMIGDEGKLSYARAYLFQHEMSEGGMTAEQALSQPKLKSEMVADFFGKRGDDIKFIRHLATRAPSTFGGFARRWIDMLTNTIDTLRGKRVEYGAKDIDQYIQKLSKAKAVAASALIEWRKTNPQFAENLPTVGATGMAGNARHAGDIMAKWGAEPGTSPAADRTTTPTPPNVEPIKQKVYRTREGAQKARRDAGNTVRMQKVRDGYVLREATEKELTAAHRSGRRLSGRQHIDVENDPLLVAIAKLGGLRFSERSDTIGEGNKNFAGRMLFTQNGRSLDDLGNHDLSEYGYIPAYERSDPAPWLRGAIKAEFMGHQQHYSDRGAQWMQDGQPDVANMSEDDLAELSAWELEQSGWHSISPEMQATTEQLLREVDEMGLDAQNLQFDASRITDGQSAHDYHTELQAQAREAIERHGRKAERADAARQGQGSGSDSQADGVQGAAPGKEQEPLTLSTQSADDLRTKALQTKAAEKAQGDEQQRLANKSKADAEVGEFTLTGSDRAADVGAAAGQGDIFSSAKQPRPAAGNSGAFDPSNPDIRYSAKRAGEDAVMRASKKVEKDRPDLLVQHSLSVDNLLHAAKMGGIPVPSLAITKADAPLMSFGDITLIGPAAMADPKGYAGTKVFGADIYSPRYPTVTFDFATGQKKRLEAEMADGMAATETKYLDYSDLSKGPRELSTTPAFLWTFAKSQSIVPDVKRHEQAKLQPRLAAFKDDTRATYDLADDPAFAEAAWNAHRDLLVQLHDGNIAKADAEVKKSRAQAQENGQDYVVGDAAREIEAYRRNKREAGGVDKYATNNAIQDQLRAKDLMPALERAAADTFERIAPNERIFQGFSDSGNRRYTPHTLEKVVAILKKELRGGEGFNYGMGSLRAKFTPQFRSVEAIRKAKNRLVTKESFEAIKKEMNEELVEISDSFGHQSLEQTIGMLEDAAKMGVDKAARLYEKDISVTPEMRAVVYDMLDKLRALPTEYFEAKILRDVDVAEFSIAVVPTGMPQQASKYLESRGVKTVEYRKGDEVDRAAQIKAAAEAAPDILFSNKQAPWYSALDRRITAADMKAGPASSWKAMVKGLVAKGDVKADEVEWSGLTDWLGLQQGKVTRAQVAVYLQANGVQVTETVLGRSKDTTIAEREAAYSAFDRGEITREERNRILGNSDIKNTKYDQYQLPSGTNYREVLLTLPQLQEEYGGWLDRMSRADSPENRAAWSKDTNYGKADYKSSHWDQPNILAHIRLNDRTDADGAKVLFVEEIQSDAAQDKRRGKTDFKAPFIETTDKWVALVLKRVIKMAVDGGYDKVAFVTGEQSAARYDLSKQVKRIEWVGARDGVKTITISQHDGNDIEFKVLPDATTASISGGESGNEFTGKRLDEVVGKDIADKIMAERDGALSGNGLRVGGEGMKAFYDKIVPSVAKDVLRKLGGGQFGPTSVDLTDYGAMGRASKDTSWRTAADDARQPGFPITQAMKDKAADGLPMFSRKQQAIKSWATNAMSSEPMRGDPVMPITNGAPHPAFTMMGAGRQQPFVLDVEHARHIANTHPEITPQVIAELPDLLKNPRAILSEKPGRLDAYVNRRDGDGNPIKVAMEKGEIRNGIQTMKVVNIQSVYSRLDSLRNIVEVAQMKTGAVWLPSEEVSRVEGLLADHLAASQKGADQTPVALPRSATGFVKPASRTLTTSLSVLSDEALRKFDQPGVSLATLPRTQIQVPRDSDLSGLMFSRKQPPQPNGHLLADVPEETKIEAGRRVNQDQHIRMRKLREWALENGAKLSAASDVYGAEERMHGRIASRVEDFRAKTVQPLIERAQKLGYTMEQVAAVMHAQHAEERNIQIAKINKEMPDGGSGMMTADARAALAKAPANLRALAAQFQAITTRSRDILLRSGVISQDTADAWDGAYKHYVPLKGDDEADAAKRAGIGKGMSVNGKTKRAMGHGAREEAIIENVLRDHEKAITLAEKNRVGQVMMLWLTEMADERIGTVDKPVKRAVLMNSKQYDVRIGNLSVDTFDTQADAEKFIRQQIQAKTLGAHKLVIRVMTGDPSVQYRARPMLEDHEAQAYVNGHAIRMQLNDPRLAQAYKRLNTDQMGRLIEISRSINTYLSKAYTGYNPAFIPRNLIRDFGSGLIKLTGNFGASTATAVVGRYPKALATLLRYSYSGTSTKSIDAYRANGGSTGAAWLGDLERIGKNVQNDYEKYQGVMALLRQGKKVAVARVAAGKVIGVLAGWIEHLNAATENAMRLATFEQILKESGSLEQSASAAKNVTINFNRKGESGPLLGALYLFFNPNVQDTASVIETLTRGKHKRQAQALVGAMIGIAYGLAALQFGGGDDDYEEWKKIPDNVRDKNLLLRTGKDSYITIPIPFGFGFFHTLGNTLFMAQHGESANQLSVGMAANLFDHFSPIGNPLQGAKGWDKADPLMMLGMLPGAPGTGELGRDAVRSIINRSSFGSPIVPDSKFDEDRPDFMRLNRTTKGTIYDATARGLSNITGGSATQSGAIDISPETLKFWTAALTGGTGTFLADLTHLAGLGVRAGIGDKGQLGDLAPELKEIPILRDYVKQTGVQDTRRAYWDAAAEIKSSMADFRRAQKGDDQTAADKIQDQHGEMIALGGALTGFNRMIKLQRDRVDEINADDHTSLAYKRGAIKQLDREEQGVYDEFLHMVTAAKNSQAAIHKSAR